MKSCKWLRWLLAVSCWPLHFNKRQADSPYILLVCDEHGLRGSRAAFYLGTSHCSGVLTDDGILPPALMSMIIERLFRMLHNPYHCLQSLRIPSIAHKCLLTTYLL